MVISYWCLPYSGSQHSGRISAASSTETRVLPISPWSRNRKKEKGCEAVVKPFSENSCSNEAVIDKPNFSDNSWMVSLRMVRGQHDQGSPSFLTMSENTSWVSGTPGIPLICRIDSSSANSLRSPDDPKGRFSAMCPVLVIPILAGTHPTLVPGA